MDFTIVTPNYNGASYIEDAILSVITQPDVRIQYIVQDSVSTDETGEVVRSLADSALMKRFISSGSSFEFRQEKDSGQSNAINRGFAGARGGILAWLNSDDSYTEKALKKCAEYFSANAKEKMIYGDINYVSQRGEFLKVRRGLPFRYKTLRDVWCFIPQPSAFWRRDLWVDVGAINESLSYCMDYEYWLRCAEKVTPQYVPHIFANYRLMPSSKTGASPLIAMPEALAVGRRFGAPYFSVMRMSSWAIRWHMFPLVKRCGKFLLRTS